MGRKGQANKSKQPVKTRNQRNLQQDGRQLQEHVDKLLRISTIPQQQNVLKALDNQREISSIVSKIKQLELDKDTRNSVDAGDRSCGALVERFAKWAKENGASFDGCSIAQFPGYDLGLKADANIRGNALVVAVPRRLMLTIEAANDSILKTLIQKDQILKNMPNVTLAVYLLLEKFQENSFWEPYFNLLPKSYTTVLYFTVEELEELRGSPTLEIALRQIKSIARQYAYFHKLFSTSDDPVSRIMKNRFTYNEYCWAVSTVMTRQNTIPSTSGSTMINALIPLWDLCNHTNGKITTDYNPELDRSECLALRDFEPGEQVFIFYGARSNADLFIHNGFVYEENEHDGYWLKLGISRSDLLQDRRLELLKRLAVPNDFCIQRGIQPIDGKLLAFLRIFNMNEGELDHWLERENSGDLQYMECALDTALEKKSWTFIQARLKLILSSYRTTLEEDEKIIKQAEMAPNKLLAIRMRLTEKRIIRDTLEYVEQNIKQ